MGKKETEGPWRRHEACKLEMGEWRGRGRVVMKDQTVDSITGLLGDTGSFPKCQAPYRSHLRHVRTLSMVSRWLAIGCEEAARLG